MAKKKRYVAPGSQAPTQSSKVPLPTPVEFFPTLRAKVREYWPLIVGGVGIAAVLGYALLAGLSGFFYRPTILIFGGDVVSANEEGITFDNLQIEGNYFGVNPSESRTLQILEPYRTGTLHTIDLGWYNTHVFSGLHYGVSAYYRDGKLADIVVTRVF